MAILQYNNGSEWINIHNAESGTAKKVMNGMGKFNIVIGRADEDQLNDLTNNTEVRFIDGDLAFYGVIRKTNGESRLVLEGTDYAYLTNKVMLQESTCPNCDSSLSDGYTVVYVAEPGRNIIYDIANTCGLTADSSSVDVFPDLNFKMRNVYGIEALEAFQEQTGCYWWIDENKKLHAKTSYGSTTETAAFNLGDNAMLVNKGTDDERRCTKAMVWGSNGSSGSYTDALYTAGEKYEGRFKFDNLTTDSECNDRAEEIVNAFKDEVLILTMKSPVQGYDMGDNVFVNGRKLDGSYRVTSITLDIQGQREIDVTNTGLDHRTDTPEEVYKKLMKNVSTDVSNIVSGDSYDELIFNGQGAAGTGHYAKIEIYIDPDKVSDVLDAKLYVVRNAVEKIYGSTTGSDYADLSQTNHDHDQNYFTQSGHDHIQNYFTQAGHDHIQNYFTQTSHDHDTTATTSGAALDGGIDIDDNDYDYNTGSSAPTSWQTILTFGNGNVNYNDMWYVMVNISYLADDINTGTYDTVYVRVNGGNSSYTYPDRGSYDYRCRIYAGHTVSFFIPIPVGWWNQSSSSIDVEWYASGGGWDYMAYAYVWSTESHVHTVDVGYTDNDYASFTDANDTDNDYASFSNANDTDNGSASFTAPNDTDGNAASISDPGHTNPLSVSIGQYDDGTSKNIDVYVDGTYVDTITLAAIGDDDTLDLSSYINTAGSHTVELRPNGDTFLSAGTRVKVFKVD